MKKNLRILSVVMTIITLCTLCSFITYAAEPSIDNFLQSKGIPQEIIDVLPQGKKEIIFETLNDTASFQSYNVQTFSVNNGPETSSEFTFNNGEIMIPMSGMISSADLTLSVVAFDITVNGVPQTSIYPSFVWKKLVKIKNDSFAMALYPNWEVIPGENNLRLWVRNVNGERVQNYDLAAAASASSGYSYKIPSNIGALQGGYEGHAYMNVKKKTSSATRAISLQYIHDTSSFFNVSYSVSIGPASISVTGNTSPLNYMSNNFYF